MRYIGYYYSDEGMYNMYVMDYVAPNWVSNICYHNTRLGRYYSPSLANISKYGRSDSGMQWPEHVWAQFTLNKRL
jgi:hypothetical protein